MQTVLALEFLQLAKHHRTLNVALRDPTNSNTEPTAAMSKGRGAGGVDQIVKLIVGAGQASPSPPVGPALGSKGVKSMDFCKVSSL
jgi:hypothetical protein